jgi:hypothetical protein
VLQDALILSLDNITESWVVYSWDSFHATPHRKYFVDYVQGDFGQVHLGDDAPCKIVGMGKVKIKQKQWKPMVTERGETCSIFKKKYNFNRAVGK